MKLDTSHMRYLTADDFKVLQAVEQGSRNHEVVPTTLIHQLSNMRSLSGTNRAISDLAKLSLISRLRNAKYDGYRLTYNGIDYLALKSLLNKGTLYSVGGTIGVGKESDIYKCSNSSGRELVMKIHRLGRTSFQTVRQNRDYLKKGARQGTNWMHLSKVAANKEYEFMRLLHANDFNIPEPVDCSRHVILMELIDGYPMRRLRNHTNVPKLYSDLMNFIVNLANHGLIHCDFNEFNIMIKNNIDGPGDCGFVVIDFPQCVSIQHENADYYFQRDVDCIRRFFKKKLKYEPARDSSMLDTSGYGDGYKYDYPVLHRDVKRINNLDELLMASGFSKKHPGDKSLEAAVESMRNYDYSEKEVNYDEDNQNGYSSDEDGDAEDDVNGYYSDVSESDSEGSEDENERIIEALCHGTENLKMDKLGNYVID